MAGKIYQTERDIVNKLSVLEYVLGCNDYSLYSPSSVFQSSDIISIQKEAVKMLRHLHMDDYMPIISYTTEKPNTGGHIELNDADDSKNIFIYISKDYIGDDAAVLCVLAHEICHKLLHIKKFKGKTTDENEVYTDLAAIYSGFGQLILNGCHDEWETSAPILNEIRTTKHTQDLGYLDIKNYAFAYALMGSMYGQSFESWDRGLSSFANDALNCVVIPPLDPSDFDREIIQVKQGYGDIMRDINLLEDGLLGVKNRIKYKLAKLDYVPDVRSWNGFSKPITAYSLLLEPYLQDEASSIKTIRELLSNKKDIRQLKTIFCPYCGNKVDVPSSLSDVRYVNFKCFACNKTFTMGRNVEEDPIKEPADQPAKTVETKRSFFTRLFGKK